MVTKGILQNINYTGNTCRVRIPYFETVGMQNNEAVFDATIAGAPGSYNGYKENDVVYVAFEDGAASAPVVIGKLYLGVSSENSNGTGALNCSDLIVTNSAILPLDTKLSYSSKYSTTVEVKGGKSSYKSISDIINRLATLEKENKELKQRLNILEEKLK